jgi:DNA-binding NarL/FixJ family response regulator
MVWVDINDVLRAETRAETDWAATHLPQTSKAPRRWRFSDPPVPWEEGAKLPDETVEHQALRLVDSGYSRYAVAAFMQVAVNTVTHYIKRERARIGTIPS